MEINIRITTSCLFLLLSFCCISRCSNANNDRFKPAVVVGTVYCDGACFNEKFSKSSHLISGASVFVKCKNFEKEVKTNRRGVFRIRLSPKTSPESCSVNLIKSSNPSCSIGSLTTKNLRLKSKIKGIHVYTTGSFSFKTEKCNENQKQVVQPDFIFFPPIPFLPSPGLPLPPNPLVPPPSLIPPVIPSPPPSVLPPIFPSPPPSLIPPVIPGLPVPLPFLAPPPPPPPSLLPPIIPGVPIPFPPLLPGNPPHSP